VYHFGTEEKLFQETCYPGYEIHKKQHDDLTRQALELQDHFQQKLVTIGYDFLEFLCEWLKRHTIESDMEFVKFQKQLKTC